MSVLTLAREKKKKHRYSVFWMDPDCSSSVQHHHHQQQQQTEICESLKLSFVFGPWWMDKDLPSSFCFASLIPDLMPTVLYVRVRAQLTLNWRKNTKKKKNVCQNTYASTKHWLLCTWLNARARRKRKKQQKKTPSFCFEKIVLSRFSLKGAQKKWIAKTDIS